MIRSFACIIVIATAVPALADPAADAAEAKVLFEEGRTLAKQGDHAGACVKFARSLELDHALGTQLNLADCNERLGHFADAWRLFDGAAADLTRVGDERAAYARGRADALAPRLMSVVVKVPHPTSPDLKVTIGGRNVQPAAEIRELVEPGAVEVVVTAPTQPRFAQTVRGLAGATVIVDVPAGDQPPHRDTGNDRRKSRVHLAWGLAGGAGLSAIASTALIIKAKRDYDHAVSADCTPTADNHIMCNQAGTTAIHDSQRLGWISTGFAAGAGLLAAGAAVVYFTAPDSVAVTPTASDSSVGVVVSGRF